jgi:uncharacterized SAM-binding protein YcdF (DUF218 family)
VTTVRRRRVAAAALLVLVVCALVALSRAGTALQIEDPLQKADAIVVIGGAVPFRAMEGGALYKQRLAPEVWLTRGYRHAAQIELERLGVQRTEEHVYSRAVLERLGVPGSVIHVIPGYNDNTATEMQTIGRYAQMRGASRVILVTSSYHSRRVRTLWRRLVGSPEAIVQHGDAEPFNASRWWADASDAFSVTREWFGLLNAWLGFPVKSENW